MQDRETSYWLMVLVGGPVAGAIAGVLWTIWMWLILGPTLGHWVIPGMFFGLWMTVIFAGVCAFTFRETRREWAVIGDEEAHRRLIAAAARMKYAPAVEQANYLRLRPKGFKIKPACSTVEVWFNPERVVIDGPHGMVSRLAKRLAKGA